MDIVTGNLRELEIAPVVRVIFSFIAGIACGVNLPCLFHTPVPLAILLAVVFLCLIVLYLSYANVKNKYDNRTFGTCIMAMAFVLGVMRCGYSHLRMSDMLSSSLPENITARVVQLPTEKARSWAVEVKPDGLSTHSLLFISKDSLNAASRLLPGDIITYRARYTTDITDTTGADSRMRGYHRYLYFNHIATTQTVSAGKWHKTGERRGLMDRLSSLRRKAMERYAVLELPTEEAAVISAISLGDKSIINDDAPQLKEAYSKAGVSHVLALSGFHITIIYTILEFIVMGQLVRRKWRWIPKTIIIFSLWLFAGIAGMPPSLVRAVLMCTIISVCISVNGSKLPTTDVITLAAFIMLMVNPFDLMNVGFQLSFLSMYGISMASPLLISLDVRCKKMNAPSVVKFLCQYLTGTIAITIVATLSTAAVVAYCFNYISVSGLMSNIVVSVLVFLLMVVIVAWWAIGWIGGAGKFLAGCMATLTKWMNASVAYFSSFKLSALKWSPSLLEVLIYYIMLITLVIFLKTKSSKFLIASLVMLTLIGMTNIFEMLFK